MNTTDLSIKLDNQTNLSIDLNTETELAIGGGTVRTYNELLGKPKINGVTLIGDKSSEELNLVVVCIDTTAHWNEQRDLLSKENYLYIYTDYITTEDGSIPGMKIGDGNSYLIDLPFLSGNVSENPYVHMGTTEYWNAHADLISDSGHLYIYTDYQVDRYGDNIPGMKVGDGSSYVIDLPFISGNGLAEHINDHVVHITAEEREFWNNKVTAYLSNGDVETLVLSKE